MRAKKQKQPEANTQAGFTLVELMVVVTILALFYGMVATNFNVWRGPQFVKLGVREIATNVNKARSYALSARNMNGNPAKFYIVRFQKTGTTNSYTLEGIATDSSGADVFYSSLERYPLPGNSYVQNLTVTKPSGAVSNPDCVQVGFSLPYGRTFVESSGSCAFQTNSQSLSELDLLANTQLVITLGRAGGTDTKTVTIDGVSGRVQNQ
jgi:prepilin-type N-terminal cleavage/methylation domain-containing protein